MKSVFDRDQLARRFVVETWLGEYAPLLDQLIKDEPTGKMFGILLAERSDDLLMDEVEDTSHESSLISPIGKGREDLVLLKAFSGQVGGVWTRPSWAPSLLDHGSIAGESWRAQRILHRLTYEINTVSAELKEMSDRRLEGRAEELRLHIKNVKRYRGELSRRHADTIRSHTYLQSFQGERCSLSSIWPQAPTGVGECCAPKLISLAHSLHLKPVGIAEFWWGPPPKVLPAEELECFLYPGHLDSQVLRFYAPCERRCQTLLPYLLGHSKV